MRIDELIKICNMNNFKLTIDFYKSIIEVYVYKENMTFQKNIEFTYDLIKEVMIFCIKNKYRY